MAISKLFLSLILAFIVLIITLEEANGYISGKTKKLIDMANKKGPYLGLVIPNLFEMNPLLQHPSYKPSNLTIDYAGKRFRFGHIHNEPVVLVMTGLAMLNSGITTQLLLALFKVKGVVHYGIAGNANPSLNIGDVAIPQYWAHTALWNWQRYGDGPEDELPLEVNGDYTRDIGYLNISKYTVNVTNCNSHNNLLNNVWYQPEEVFPVFGTPEDRQHIFWVPIDPHYYAIAKKLEGMKLEGCLNATTCLSHPPEVSFTISLMSALSKWKVLLLLSFATNRRYLTSLSVPSPTWPEEALPNPMRLPPSSPSLPPTPLKSLCNLSSNINMLDFQIF